MALRRSPRTSTRPSVRASLSGRMAFAGLAPAACVDRVTSIYQSPSKILCSSLSSPAARLKIAGVQCLVLSRRALSRVCLFHQLQEFISARAIELPLGIEPRGGLQFGQSFLIAVHAHQAGRERVMVIGGTIQAQALAEFFLRCRQLLLLEQRRPENVVRGIGIRVERYGEAQLAHAFFELVVQQECFAKSPVLGGPGGILPDRQL